MMLLLLIYSVMKKKEMPQIDMLNWFFIFFGMFLISGAYFSFNTALGSTAPYLMFTAAIACLVILKSIRTDTFPIFYFLWSVVVVFLMFENSAGPILLYKVLYPLLILEDIITKIFPKEMRKIQSFVVWAAFAIIFTMLQIVVYQHTPK